MSLKGTGKFTSFFRVFIKANLEHQVAQAIVSKTWTKRLKNNLIITRLRLLKLEINMKTPKNEAYIFAEKNLETKHFLLNSYLVNYVVKFDIHSPQFLLNFFKSI